MADDTVRPAGLRSVLTNRAGAWPPGDDDMAGRIRAFDWAATPLGGSAGWSERLKAVVEMALASPLVSSVVCGRQRILIYNDAAARLYGQAHPAALGAALPEIFPAGYAAVQGLYDRAFAGESVAVTDQPLDTRNEGDAKDRFDAWLTPVRDERGTVIAAHMLGFEVNARVAAQTALRESEERYRALVTAGAPMVYRMSPDWRVMNQLSGRDILADAAEPIENWADDYLLPEDRPGIAAAIDEAIRARSLFDLEHRVRTADGGVGWIHSRAVPMLGPHGEITEWFGAGADIQGRKRVEAALREREADLARVQRIGRVGGLNIDVADGLRSLRSPEYLRLHGLPKSAAEESHADWLARVHPDDRDRAEQALFSALRSDVATYESEYRIVRPADGAIRRIHARADIERTGDGKPTRLVGAHIDITEQKRMQDALRESEERLRQFGEASSDVLWTRDAETLRWDYLTPAFEAIYGLPREEALSGNNLRNWAELIVPEDREHVLDQIRRVREGESVTFEYRVRRPADGQIRWLRDTDFPILDDAGRVQRIGGISHDATKEKQAEQALADGERQAKLLLAELQHRVRNTLAVVRSIVRRSAQTSETVEDYAMHLDGRLNAFARVQAAVTRNPGAGISLDELVADELTAYAAREGEQFTISGPELRLHSKAAETLGLALHELATNSVKYGAMAEPQGRVNVEWEVKQDGGSPMLSLDWRESGVPAIVEPKRTGFGTELLQRTLSYELKARTSLSYAAPGLHCAIELPLTAAITVLDH